MRIAALVHFYVPFRCAGSETMLHTLLKRLAANGHEVQAFSTHTPDAPFKYTYEGIQVTSCNTWTSRQFVTAFRPDVIVTHHQNTPRAVKLAKHVGAKSVFLMHNDFDLNRIYLRTKPDLVVFNTNWISQATQYAGESVVIHPPVFPEEHKAIPGDRVTLVNLNAHKGGELFYRLAERMPDVDFLGVVGGHGEQIIRTDLPNVEIVQHTDDMPGKVWCRTRLLLMPSVYESYGMAGVEAMASGIPVIANPTPGLLESLDTAGTFIARDDVDGWEAGIRRLLDPVEWSKASGLASARSTQLDPTAELDVWVDRLEGLH